MEDQNLMKSVKSKHLAELVLRQSQEIETLSQEIAQLEAELADPTLSFECPGTLRAAVEPWLQLIAKADEEAKPYLEQIRQNED